MDTKKLRQKILDLAIRGKLVPQDPNDEPASVLLERIRAEKEQLIKEGKIKRSKKSAATDKSHYENVPFEIPESWCWTTVSAISKSILYGVSESAKACGKYRLLRITDIQNNNVQWNNVPYTDFDSNKAESYLLNDGDILFARTGATVGKSYLVQGLTEKAIYASYLIRVQTYNAVLPQYIKFYFESGYYWEQIEQESVGVGQPNVNGSILGNLQIPIPPIHEQNRIVLELTRWKDIIDAIEDGTIELESYVKQTKSKILDLAISGKLVPQDPNDEPAIEILRRINPGFKPCDNSHYENIEFDIPQNWVWATIGDIFEHNTGKALNASNPNGTMLDYITTSNLYWDRFELSIIKQMPFTESEIERCIVRKGDLLICEGGDVGRAAIWDYDYNIMIQNHIHRLRGKVDICTRYFFYLFMHYKLHNLIGGKGVAIQGLSSRDLHNLIIPVPSLKEQYDIASSIDLYFSKLDMITAEL